MLHAFAGTFNYAYTDAHPGIVRGYVFTVCKRAHVHCGCMRGKPCVLFMEHNSAAGDFPMHFLDAYYLISEYLQQHNLDILSDDELDEIWSAYGWIYEWQLLRTELDSYGFVRKMGQQPRPTMSGEKQAEKTATTAETSKY